MGRAVSGITALATFLHEQVNARLVESEKIAGKYSRKALNQFRQHQFASLHEPDGKAKPDTAAMRSAAKAFAEAYQSTGAVTAMGVPWINRSFRAARTVYADFGSDDEAIFFKLYHTMSYGVYLELAKDRKYAVLEPIVRGLAKDFLKDLKEVYSG